MLPTKTKTIGYILAAVALISISVLAFAQVELSDNLKDSLPSILVSLLNIGLLLSILSKESIEDERTNDYRLRAFQRSFVVGVLFGIISFILGAKSIPAIALISVMMTIYLVYFNFYLRTDNV